MNIWENYKLNIPVQCSIHLKFEISLYGVVCFKYFKYLSDRTGSYRPLDCVFITCLEPAMIGDEQMFKIFNLLSL